ncbi:MAG TPA: hypothetical protein VHV54_01790, partial [Candidatus Binatia bacterium]|nr:hypothetical protein [Candidatus Binatia bacterium]
MKLLQIIKSSLVGKPALAALSGTSATGTVAETILSGVRRTARHPMTEGAVLLAGTQYVAAIIGLVTSIVSARVLGPKDFGLAT